MGSRDDDPSNAELLHSIEDILDGVDLQKWSVKRVRQRLESDYNVSLRSRRAYLEVAVLKTVRDVQAKTALAQAQLESDDDDADAEEDSAVVSLLGMAKPPEPVDSTKGTSALTRSYQLSPELAALVGFRELTRPKVSQEVWRVIRERKFKDPKDGRRFICTDPAMKRVFREPRVHMFDMNKIISYHLLDDKGRRLKPFPSPEDLPNSVGTGDAPISVTAKSKKKSAEENEEEPSRKRPRLASNNSEATSSPVATSTTTPAPTYIAPSSSRGSPRLTGLSASLAALLGCQYMPRSTVHKRIWALIGSRNLKKDSKDRRSYLLDGELSGLLGADRVNLASLSPLLNKHMRLELKDPQEISTAKKEWIEFQAREEMETAEHFQAQNEKRKRRGRGGGVGGGGKKTEGSRKRKKGSSESDLSDEESDELSDDDDDDDDDGDDDMVEGAGEDDEEMSEMESEDDSEDDDLDDDEDDDDVVMSVGRKRRRGTSSTAAATSASAGGKSAAVQLDADGNVKKTRKKRVQRPGTGSFHRFYRLSDPLAAFIGATEPVMTRSETMRRVWATIRDRGIQKTTDKRILACDSPDFLAIFEAPEITMYVLNTKVFKQLEKLSEREHAECVARAEKVKKDVGGANAVNGAGAAGACAAGKFNSELSTEPDSL